MTTSSSGSASVGVSAAASASASGIERIGPSTTAGERQTLREFLDFHRATLALKCDGLTDEQLRRRASPPSTLSLLGLLRHMAEVERTWFRIVFAGEKDLPLVWSDTMDYQAAYEPGDCTWQAAFAAWQAEVGHARRIEREAASLDVVVHAERWGRDVSLRVILNHMVHEYARHNGHADLLREAVDGTVGT